MPLWLAKSAVLAASIVMIVIRAPHGHRSSKVKVAKSYRGRLEFFLLTLAWISFFLPLIWIVVPLFKFADYPLLPAPFAVGVVCFVIGLWLFHRSHADLGTNWSITLEVREEHTLITQGVYRRIRHPMYSALFLFAIGEALVLPNWIVGPSYLVVLLILFAFRLRAEEKMMLEKFGGNYNEYMARTKRLIPHVW